MAGLAGTYGGILSSAGWTRKNRLHPRHSLPILPSLVEDARIRHRYSVSLVSFADVRNSHRHD
jgi:hypothetical protein